MNIYDWVIIATIAVAALIGMSKGAVTMALGVVGIFVAMLLGGQFAAPLVRNFTDSVDSEAIATVIGYGIIFLLVFIAMGYVARFVRVGLTVTMLGWVDKLGGVALGVVVGFMLSIGITMVAARYTYVIDSTSESGGATALVDRYLSDLGRDRLDRELTESELVSVLIDVRNAVPGEVLGLVPNDFNLAMDTLEDRVDRAS